MLFLCYSIQHFQFNNLFSIVLLSFHSDNISNIIHTQNVNFDFSLILYYLIRTGENYIYYFTYVIYILYLLQLIVVISIAKLSFHSIHSCNKLRPITFSPFFPFLKFFLFFFFLND